MLKLYIITKLSKDTKYPGWLGGAMVLGKLPVPGVLLFWLIVGQGPTALALGAGGGCLDIFTLIFLFSPLSPSLWETVRYRLKYCLKGPLNPKQPTNQPQCISYATTCISRSDFTYDMKACQFVKIELRYKT